MIILISDTTSAKLENIYVLLTLFSRGAVVVMYVELFGCSPNPFLIVQIRSRPEVYLVLL